jgi:hypothetical protein
MPHSALLLVAWSCITPSAFGQQQQWGDIEGRIVLRGPIHPRRALNFKGHPDAKLLEADKEAFDEDWIVNKENKGIKNVMVWIRPAGLAKDGAFPPKQIHPNSIKPPTETLQVDIAVSKFAPHVLGARQGQKLIINNSSALCPTVKFESQYNGDHLVRIPLGESFTLPKPLVAEWYAIQFESVTHPWMHAYLRIFDHPYFAITDENGKYTIKNAPAGRSNVWYWHPAEGWLGGKNGRNGYAIEIKPGRNKLGDNEFAGPDSPPPTKFFWPEAKPVGDPNLPRGNLRGRVVWKGDIPQQKPIELGKHPDAIACSKQNLLDEDWIVNAQNNGVKNVVVWISDSGPYDEFPQNFIHPKMEKPERDSVAIDVSGCRFEPHVLVARKGQNLVVRDNSTLTHRVDWYSLKNSRAEAVEKGKNLTFNDLKVDPWPIVLKCGNYPWMKAHLRVFDHPYFAVTDANGAFSITDAPAGDFRIYYWHPVKGMLNGKLGDKLTIMKGNNELAVREMGK